MLDVLAAVLHTHKPARDLQQLSALVSQREALAFSEEELEAALHQLGSSSENFIMCGEHAIYLM